MDLHGLIDQVFGYELDYREERNWSKLMEWAKFPQQLNLEQSQLSEQSAIVDKQLNGLKELYWIEKDFTLIG